MKSRKQLPEVPVVHWSRTASANVHTNAWNIPPLAAFCVILIVTDTAKHFFTPGCTDNDVWNTDGLDCQWITKVVDTTEMSDAIVWGFPLHLSQLLPGMCDILVTTALLCVRDVWNLWSFWNFVRILDPFFGFCF